MNGQDLKQASRGPSPLEVQMIALTNTKDRLEKCVSRFRERLAPFSQPPSLLNSSIKSSPVTGVEKDASVVVSRLKSDVGQINNSIAQLEDILMCIEI